MIKVSIEPSAKLNLNLKLLFDRTSPEYLEIGAIAGAKVIAAAAKDIVPIDTGDLQSTIRVLPGPKGARSSSALVVAGGRAPSGNDVNYAGYIEFGTSRMAAQPFMRPAYDKFKAEAVKETGDAVFTSIFNPRSGTRDSGFSLPKVPSATWETKFK